MRGMVLLQGEGESRRYVVVEGVIGVGKTTLVRRLSERLDAWAVFEEFEDNPFLPAFYEDPRAHALSTQLFFLMSRFRQQEALLQPDLFRPHTVADYLFDKDRIFAELTLDPAERVVYEQLFRVLAPRVPRPDLVIYLRASADVILERIRRRGRVYEQSIELTYLEDLAASYARFFASYREAPMVVVDTGRADLRADSTILDVLDAGIRGGPLPRYLDERGSGPDLALPFGEPSGGPGRT